MTSTSLTESAALEKAQRLHAENIVVDSMSPHFVAEWCLTPPMVELAKQLQAEGRKRFAIQQKLADYLIEHCETDAGTREAYMAYWRRSGVAAGNNTLYGTGAPDSAWESLVAEFGRAARMITAMKGELVQANCADDIVAAYKAGRKAVFYNIQNAEPVGDKFERVDTLWGLGLRSMQLTYNLRTRFGEGCLEKNDGGISRFGEALVHKMNERRMLVDASHASARTAMDAALCSSRPIVASHTAARAISGHARGLPDDVLRTIAERGGYAGVVILPAFLVPPGGDGRAEKIGKPAGWATLDTLVDHVQHLIDVMGEDHVGIGTDWGKPYYTALEWTPAMVHEAPAGFDWVGWRPEDRFDPNNQTAGMETWDKWHNITAALLGRGLAESTVVKLVGGNFLRVFREVCG
jgi:membrane dipeptidase